MHFVNQPLTPPVLLTVNKVNYLYVFVGVMLTLSGFRPTKVRSKKLYISDGGEVQPWCLLLFSAPRPSV